MMNKNVKIKIGMAAIAFIMIAAELIFTAQYTKTSPTPFPSENNFLAQNALLNTMMPPKPSPSPLAFLKLPIIMYHHVEIVKNSHDYNRKKLGITPEAFEKQLKLFSDNGYASYFVKDIPKILSGEITHAPKKIVLTFDDGYNDFYSEALPLLKKYNTRATIYIIYDFIGREGYLSKNEIKEIIQSNLVEIGSHSLDHKSFEGLKNEIVQKEISESKENLEKLFHITITSLAYPYGDFTPMAIKYAKDAQYTNAVAIATNKTIVNDGLFYLPRIRAGVFTKPNTIQLLDLYEK